MPLKIDIARLMQRPHTLGPAHGQNFLYDSAHGRVRPLTTNELFRRIPISYRICRIYARSDQHAGTLAKALDELIGGPSAEDLTNM